MVTCSHKTAEKYEAIKPLMDLCRAGRLFDVQKWIADGKPVNPSPPPEKKPRKQSPLQVAIDKGFHSLAQVLLEGGALVEDGTYNALEQALFNRRLDLIELLVAHGADIKSVEMCRVFDTWDPAIMEYFIAQGADVQTGYPLAGALCSRIRSALGVFRRHKDRFPSFQDQIDMALRQHCREGNLKWVSLLLWAGADPFARGPDSPGDDTDPDEQMCALELAALYEHFEIFKLKKIRIAPDQPIAGELLLSACRAKEANFLVDLLRQGFRPSDQKDRGSSLIMACIYRLAWYDDYGWLSRDKKRDIDSSRSREGLKMIHILAKHGAKWIPMDINEIKEARRIFLKMKIDYTIEFIWIMARYRGCSRDTIEQLLDTPAIRRHVAPYQPRISDLLKDFAQALT